MTTAAEYAKMSESEKRKEDWLNTKWRPMMGWSYMATCITDFVIFPILWSIVQMIGGGEVKMQWQPLTLQGAGLYHIAMGAVLGLATWGRTQEKLNGVSGGSTQLPTNIGTTYQPPQSSQQTMPFANNNFNTSTFGFNTPPITQMDQWGQVNNSSRGKPMPVQPPMPER
ncbi:hypothetical protein EB118_10080 [bacterium]|nr:hypothetical protein [bacterium]